VIQAEQFPIYGGGVSHYNREKWREREIWEKNKSDYFFLIDAFLLIINK
jgi:hypothetical protein